jgi:TonB family protein
MLPEVYSARDVAAAAGVSDTRVESLIAHGEIRTLAAELPPGLPMSADLGAFISHQEAVRAVRALVRGRSPVIPDAHGGPGRELFADQRHAGRPTAVPLAVSTGLHGLVAVAFIVASLGFAAADERTEPLKDPEPMRLVFLAMPGPGGGGGGGGLRMKAPPPKAAREGTRRISSPLPARTLPPPVVAQPKPVEPPPKPLEAKVMTPVMAPILEAPADKQTHEGVMAKADATAPSQGPGTAGGVGTGQGTGLGPGEGTGIGDGSGGGTGGGPYRPGSGVEPPRLLREVRADYSDAARRANLEGEVLMEIVVRRDGTVGDVRILRGLGLDLNDRAVQAVRQWRFSPAHLKGAVVDVVVEVSVEFKLR